MMSNFNIKDLQSKFYYSEPFNHIVIDNFLDINIAEALLHDLNTDNYNTWDKRDDDKIQVKWRSDWKSDLDVPENTFKVIQYFNSGNFLRWLSEITGIEGIIPDPYLTGGGFNLIKNGGSLAIHADGNWHDLMKVHRRLNVILYLNKNWQDSWGGHFEIWSSENGKPKKCEKKIRPDFNRLVIFKTDDFSFHGHPTPIKCPDTEGRKSLILYYYTSSRPKEEVISLDNKHRALFFHPDEIGIEYV